MASVTSSTFGILRRPVITEKAAVASTVGNAVVFEVHPQANKSEIRKAVETIFDVKVKAVRTANTMGKLKRVRVKVGKQKDWKKAYITLAEGSSIDIVEGL